MNFLYFLYFQLPGFSNFGIIGKGINRLLALVLKRIFDMLVPFYLKRTSYKAGIGINQTKREKYYIVSLTSFPARINEIWISIETILRQSFKPDMIILWLAEDQFPDKKLPSSLTGLIKRGLTIRFCEDIKSHKKYYFAMKEFPDSFVITFDDDLYYPSNALLNIVELNKKFPGLIAANRAHKFTFKNGVLIPYRQWIDNVTDSVPSHILVQTGGAGALFPPGSLNPMVFEKEIFKSLCFYADDLWLKMMAYLNNTMIVTNDLYNKDFITTGKTQHEKLVTFNVINGGNDKQFANLCNFFSIDLKSLDIEK